MSESRIVSTFTSEQICALRKALKDGVLWLRCSQGFFWTSVINLLVILKDWSRPLHLSSKVIRIFLWSPCDQSFSFVFWHWFKGSLVIPTSTPRAGSGETCTLWQEHRHGKVIFPQQILYKVLQENTVWTKHLTLPLGFCWWGSELWALLTPLSVLREVNSRNPAQAPRFLSPKLMGENESLKMNICQINQTFYGGKEGWRVLCSTFRADAAQVLLLLPMLHLPPRSEPTNCLLWVQNHPWTGQLEI